MDDRSHYEKTATITDYIMQKLSMLEDEFYIKLSYEDIAHMRSLKTEEAVDRYAHQLLMDKL